MQVIPRIEAEKLYKTRKTIYIGVHTKNDDGKWWDMNEFSGLAKCVPHVNGSFEKITSYFNKHYCPGCRIRYGILPRNGKC